MYEREESLIEQAERLAAETTAGLPPTFSGAGDAATLSAIRSAIGARESALSLLSPVYQSLRSRAPGAPAEARARRDELLPRAWRALLSVEREKDFLLNDLHRLQGEAAGPHEH
jgi:hypothetical protein